MRIHLIRHGQTQSNVDHLLDTAYPGAPLTALGHQQAEALVETLREVPLDAVYASTLTRAQQTAQPLATARGLDVRVLEGVQEIAAGVEEMSPDWTTYVEMLQSWSPANMDAKLEGGESAREFMARYNGAIQRVWEKALDDVAIVTHGAAMRVWAITHLAAEYHHLAPPLHNTQWITLDGDPTSGWSVRQWGETTW